MCGRHTEPVQLKVLGRKRARQRLCGWRERGAVPDPTSHRHKDAPGDRRVGLCKETLVRARDAGQESPHSGLPTRRKAKHNLVNRETSEDLVDRAYLARLTDFDSEVEKHIRARTPQWAAQITGLGADEIVDFARLYGSTRKSFIRAGFGFTRTRNGPCAMHAVSCLPAMTGAWAERGGGAFFLTFDSSLWGIDTTLLHGLDVLDTSVRVLDQSRIGAVLVGERAALRAGGRVKPAPAMLMPPIYRLERARSAAEGVPPATVAAGATDSFGARSIIAGEPTQGRAPSGRQRGRL